MDSLSQFGLGAAVGEVVLGRKLGNKAPIIGGIMGTIPDLDVLFTGFYRPVEALLVHRGMSHSLFFALVCATIFSAVFSRLSWTKKYQIKLSQWWWFGFLTIFTHPLLDLFTTYGTGILEPFSHHRFGIDSIFIIDPLYTVPLIICVIISMCLRKDSRRRQIWRWLGIILSTAYLFFSLIVRSFILSEVAAKNSVDSSVWMAPGPMTTFLWTSVVEAEDQFIVGQHHLWKEKKNPRIFIPKEKLPTEVQNHPDTQTLFTFSRGKIVFRVTEDRILAHDLKFIWPLIWKDESSFWWTYEVAKKVDGIWKVDIKKSSQRGPDLPADVWGKLWEAVL